MAATYERQGDGPHRVVVLHGWFGSATAWSALRPHLDGSAFSYVFPNYRGYGARKHETGDYSIAEAGADVLALADELGWPEFSLVGHSMSGSVMQRVLADAPGRVRAMVGIAPVPASGVPFDEQSWQLFSSAAQDPGSRRAIIDFTTGGRHTGVWLDAMVAHSLENSDVRAFAAYLESWAKTDFHDEVTGKDVPVKTIVGEHDPAIAEEFVRATYGQQYPRLELEVMANAGHYPMDETPIATATSIERFLEKC